MAVCSAGSAADPADQSRTACPEEPQRPQSAFLTHSALPKNRVNCLCPPGLRPAVRRAIPLLMTNLVITGDRLSLAHRLLSEWSRAGRRYAGDEEALPI